MATVVQQSQPLQSAGDFWRAQMEKRPNLHGWLTSIWAVVSFFVNGHVIVHAARWVIRWCGYVAESALLFAVLWISGTSVAPGFIELFMSKGTMQWLVWLSLLALALIPEVILGNAIINTVSHWQRVANNRRKIMSWVWAILFTLPTAMFFLLTAITINTLTSNGGNVVQAGNTMLGLRCFTGWTYGLLTIVYAGVGKITVQSIPTPASAPTIDYTEIVTKVSAQIQENLTQQLREFTQQTQTKLDEVLAQNLAQTSPQTQSNVAPDSAQNLGETQDESDRETDPNLHAVSPKTRRQTRSTSSNKTYAITKREAAQRLHCSIKDIERGIEDGKVKLYANSEKVLVSSLKNFTPTRRLRVVNE